MAEGSDGPLGVSSVILAALSRAQRKTIAELYRSHGAMVLRRARQITGNEHDAEEVVQEIFGKLLEEPEGLDRARNPTAWLYGATTHLCLNRIRNRKNRDRLLREKVMPVAQQQSSIETAAFVQQALAALPDELSSTFVYYYVDQMTHSEIAGILGCSRRQVGNLLERAHAKLERLTGPLEEVRHE